VRIGSGNLLEIMESLLAEPKKITDLSGSR